jgi:hypothetical protein
MVRPWGEKEQQPVERLCIQDVRIAKVIRDRVSNHLAGGIDAVDLKD